MAIFGSLGKTLGLGTARQFGTAIGGPITGAFLGGISEAISKGTQPNTQQGQSVAATVQPQPKSIETAAAGSQGGQQGTVVNIGYSDMAGGGFERAAFTTGIPATPSGGIQTAGLPMVVGRGLVAGGGALRNMLLGAGAGIAAPMIVDAITGQPKKLRVTRKMKRDVTNAVMLLGIDAVASQLNVDASVVMYILTKKIRNDGPYVTKAAVRKTRSTIGKMARLCNMYDDLRPKAARRAPARRASTTKVTQIRN